MPTLQFVGEAHSTNPCRLTIAAANIGLTTGHPQVSPIPCGHPPVKARTRRFFVGRASGIRIRRSDGRAGSNRAGGTRRTRIGTTSRSTLARASRSPDDNSGPDCGILIVPLATARRATISLGFVLAERPRATEANHSSNLRRWGRWNTPELPFSWIVIHETASGATAESVGTPSRPS